MMNRSVVINREFGSGGREIGRLISERTGADFYDSRILQEAAARRGVPANQLAAFDERLATAQYLNLSLPGFSDPEFAAMPYRVFSVIADVITEAATVAPGVFIGRCADAILREAQLPLLSVFVLSTDTKAKVARAIEADNVPPKDAEKYIVKMDKTRTRYQQFFTGTRFGDSREYDLCLNSGRLGLAACADAIESLLGEPSARTPDQPDAPEAP